MTEYKLLSDVCVVYICSDETMTEPVRPDDEVCVYRWRSMNFWQWPVCCVYLQWRNNDGTGMTWRWDVCWLFICSDGTMTEYDLMTMTCLRVLRGHKGPVRAIQVGIYLCVWLGLVVGWLVSWRTDDWIVDFWVKAMTGLVCWSPFLFVHSLVCCSPYFFILCCCFLLALFRHSLVYYFIHSVMRSFTRTVYSLIDTINFWISSLIIQYSLFLMNECVKYTD